MPECQIVTKVITGDNALSVLKQYRKERIVVICDKFLSDTGAIHFVTEQLEGSNAVTIFDGTVPDPTLEVVSQCIALSLSVKPTIIIAFGGGSAIDTAKAVIYFSMAGKVIQQKPCFIIVPTTSGTGSEMTSLTVLTDSTDQRKHVIQGELLYADLAILDPHLVVSVPPSVTANTGFDAITHALEAYVCSKASDFTDGVACKSFELSLKSLLVCYTDGKNLAARKTMHNASNMAGIAFTLSGLGMNHSLAHQLGGIFHVPHGLACALFIPSVITYNSRDVAVLEKYADLAYKVGIAPRSMSPEQAVTALKAVLTAMMQFMHMPTHIRELKQSIDRTAYEAQIPRMAENALLDRCLPDTPVPLTKDEAAQLFRQIY